MINSASPDAASKGTAIAKKAIVARKNSIYEVNRQVTCSELLNNDAPLVSQLHRRQYNVILTHHIQSTHYPF